MNSKYNLIVEAMGITVFKGRFRKEADSNADSWWCCVEDGQCFDQDGRCKSYKSRGFYTWAKPQKISEEMFNSMTDTVSKIEKLRNFYLISGQTLYNELRKKEKERKLSKK